MKYWHEPPYHGDGKSRNSKPRRRYVNLKRERRTTALLVIGVGIFLTTLFMCIAFSPDQNDNNTTKIGALVIGSIFTITAITGILSYRKFRKGYDIDISDKTAKEHEKDDGKR